MLVSKAVELHGSFSHTWSTWERVLRLLGKERLRPAGALRVYDFADWQAAFSDMADRTVLKAVMTL
jgi:L-iditol 2-dehydrogenase